MTTVKRPIESELLHCDVCMQEIPKSEAHNTEVEDYVMHFCGLECYAQWQQQAPPAKKTQRSQKR
jgi:hypothetical protein